MVPGEECVWGGGGLIRGWGYSKQFVCVCVCGGSGGRGGDGVNACQPDRASSVQQGQLGVSTRL